MLVNTLYHICPSTSVYNFGIIWYTLSVRNKMPRWRNWYTRTTQNRVSQGVRVRLPPEALYKNLTQLAEFLFLIVPRSNSACALLREGVEKLSDVRSLRRTNELGS